MENLSLVTDLVTLQALDELNTYWPETYILSLNYFNNKFNCSISTQNTNLGPNKANE